MTPPFARAAHSRWRQRPLMRTPPHDENQEGPGLAPRAFRLTVLGYAYARRFAKQSLQ
ncbi:hypothetical protein BH24CHL8_BH24CHL8_03750 [soil metagenome]